MRLGHFTQLGLLAIIAAISIATASAQAEIYRWDNGQVIPGTTGIWPHTYMDLSDWDTAGHTLEYADFTHMDIDGSRFDNCDLDFAKFVGASAVSAVFTGESMDNADFSGADLKSAEFETSAQNADFQNTDLTGAFLFSTLTNANFSGATLTNADLDSAVLTSANLSGTTLTGAFLENAKVGGADFAGADITSVDFEDVTGLTASQFYSTKTYQSGTLNGIALGGDDLTGWNFQNMTCAVDFSGANLTNVNFHNANLAGSSMGSTNLTGADFSGSSINGTNISGGTGFTSAMLYSTASYQSGTLSCGIMSEDLTGWNFSHMQLQVAFSRSIVTNMNLIGSTIANCDFSQTTGFTSSQLYSTASYQNHDLHGVGLGSLDMINWDFSSQNLSKAYLAAATITGANFTGANLTGAEFFQATATGANFTGANLTGVFFEQAALANVNFTGATISNVDFTKATGLTAEQLYSTASYQSRDLMGVVFKDDDLTGWNFADQNLTGADFAGANLTNADFTNSIIQWVSFYSNLTTQYPAGPTLRQIYSTASYKSHDLDHIQWGASDFTNGNFSGQDCSGDSFTNMNLMRANFSSANLSGAWFFFGANLVGANFNHANLSNIDVGADVDASGANFGGANLDGAYLNGTFAAANFAGATLTNAHTYNADFSDADFRGATGFNIYPSLLHDAILPDGTIAGLNMQIGETLIIRNNPTPVTVTGSATFVSWSSLQYIEFLLDSNWTSPMIFAPGVAPTLAGSLDLNLADDADPASLVGTTFQVFQWSTPLPGGDEFLQILPGRAGFVWDTANLYTNGTVTLLAVPEPTGAALIATALLGMVFRRRARN